MEGTLKEYKTKKKRSDGLKTYHLTVTLGKDPTTKKGYRQKIYTIHAENDTEAKKQKAKILADIATGRIEGNSDPHCSIGQRFG